MWDRKEVKERGKKCFKGNYWRSVLSAFLISILAGGTSVASRFASSDQDVPQDTNPDEAVDVTLNGEPLQEALNNMPAEDQAVAGMVIAGLLAAAFVVFIIGFLLKIFVFNPLQVGCFGFFKENASGLQPDLGILKTGFTRYGHTFITLFLRDLFTLLWTLLFIVPGIIKVYSYRMVPFILRDHPEMSATEVITASRRLMDGHKWNMFVFDLSYIGWFLLGAITFGLVNIFWTEPYRQNANAAIYLKLIGEVYESEEPGEFYEPEDVIPLSSNE